MDMQDEVDPKCFYVRGGKCYKNEPCHLHPLRRRLKYITVVADYIILPEHRGGAEIKLPKTGYVVDKGPEMM